MNIRKVFTIVARWCYQWVRPKPSYYHKVNEVGVVPAEEGKPRLIVSLTSFPARIKTVSYTIESILLQKKKANKVILWLAEEQFPAREKELPQKLLRLRNFGLEIAWCRDIRSYKKLIPALKAFPGDIIVTADDDIWYPPQWMENFYNSYLNNPECIFSDKVLEVKVSDGEIEEYNNWGVNIFSPQPPSFLWHIVGCGGVLYPPHSLHPDVIKEEVFMKIAPKVDDIWFWAMAILNNTKIRIVNNNIYNFEGVFIVNNRSLWDANILGHNDESLNKICKIYPIIKDRIICASKNKEEKGVVVSDQYV